MRLVIAQQKLFTCVNFAEIKKDSAAIGPQAEDGNEIED